MTTELIAFIEARLADDEQVARAATEGQGWSREPHSGRWRSAGHGCDWGAVDDEVGGVIVFDEGAPNGAQAAHIARYDPARVLREVAAKRRLLEHVWRYEERIDQERGCCCDWEKIAAGLCQENPLARIEALRDFAVVWSDHPDYREEWRP